MPCCSRRAAVATALPCIAGRRRAAARAAAALAAAAVAGAAAAGAVLLRQRAAHRARGGTPAGRQACVTHNCHAGRCGPGVGQGRVDHLASACAVTLLARARLLPNPIALATCICLCLKQTQLSAAQCDASRAAAPALLLSRQADQSHHAWWVCHIRSRRIQHQRHILPCPVLHLSQRNIPPQVGAPAPPTREHGVCGAFVKAGGMACSTSSGQ